MAEPAKKLPLGRLYANGRGFVPNIRQDLYSDLVVALGLEPQAALSPETDKDNLPAARGLPRSWDEIGAGHLVIAQESLDYGWWEAIVLDRQRRHVHAAVPRLPAPAQVRPASQRHCDDEPAYRRSQACGSEPAGLTA